MRPKVVAHRGASYLAPENTLSAFRLAASMGVDGIEMDVVMTADYKPVVHHDYIIDLHTDYRNDIPSMTEAELRQLDFGSWKGEEFAGERIPTLAEALDACKSVDGIHLEFKSQRASEGGNGPFADTVVQIVKESGCMEKLVVSSFDHGLIRRVKAQLPELCVGVHTLNSIDSYFYLPTSMRPGFVAPAAPDPDSVAQESVSDMLLRELNGPRPAVAVLDVMENPVKREELEEENGDLFRYLEDRIWAITSDHPGENLFGILRSLANQHDLASYVAGLDFPVQYAYPQYNTCYRDTRLIQKLQSRGIRVAPWPVDGEINLRSFIEMGPDTIVTNRPEQLLAIYEEMGL